ncbi:MAG: hypothetical protein EBZ48_11180 [Proteobacteria bacterium]|nr:hypothetical protein [Pseudomonadota bacterium]
MDGQSAQASFDRFERVQDGQARSREDRKWGKEFEKSRQLLSDQIIATAVKSLVEAKTFPSPLARLHLRRLSRGFQQMIKNSDPSADELKESPS